MEVENRGCLSTYASVGLIIAVWGARCLLFHRPQSTPTGRAGPPTIAHPVCIPRWVPHLPRGSALFALRGSTDLDL